MINPVRAWWRDETWPTRIAVVVIIGLGVAQRAVLLGQPMRYDESVTYLYFAGRSWYTAISAYQFPNNHLLYTVIAKATSSLMHGAPWALRLPAFLAGVAILPLTYTVGRVLFTPASALIGTALVAGSTTLTLYATNARGYSLVVVAYLLLLLLGARIRAGHGRSTIWIAFACASAAGLATIPTMLYPMGAAAMWLALVLIVDRGRAARRDLLTLAAALAAAVLLAGLAYLPIINANGIAALTANKFVVSSPWPQFFGELFPSLGHALAGWSQPFPLLLLPILMGALVVGVARSTRISHEGVSVMIAGLMWSAVVLLGNHRAPFPRTWLWLLPIACLLVGVSVEPVGASRDRRDAFSCCARTGTWPARVCRRVRHAEQRRGGVPGYRTLPGRRASRPIPPDRVTAGRPCSGTDPF